MNRPGHGIIAELINSAISFRSGSWPQCASKIWRSKLSMNLRLVGTPRCGVRAVSRINGRRTAQRAVPTHDISRSSWSQCATERSSKLPMNRLVTRTLLSAAFLRHTTARTGVSALRKASFGSWPQCATVKLWKLTMNLATTDGPLTPTLSPAAGERENICAPQRGPLNGDRFQRGLNVTGQLSGVGRGVPPSRWPGVRERAARRDASPYLGAHKTHRLRLNGFPLPIRWGEGQGEGQRRLNSCG